MNDTHVTARKPCKRCGCLLRYRSGGCVQCVRGKSSSWRKNNLEHARVKERAWRLKNPKKARATQEAYRARHAERVLLNLAKRRAREAGLPFDLEETDIEIPEVCPVLGIVIARVSSGTNGPKTNSPSVDRIVPALGYVKGNVRVISWRANNLRRDATAEELRLVAEDAARLEQR